MEAAHLLFGVGITANSQLYTCHGCGSRAVTERFGVERFGSLLQRVPFSLTSISYAPP